MSDSFLAGQVRGTDSAGLFVLHKDNSSSVEKMGLDGSAFLRSKDTQLLLRRIPACRLALGHVRAATVGMVSKDNAHPFTIKREDGTFITGVHNGTLTGWRSKKDAEKFTVDSEWLFHMLSIEGHDAFEYFAGAFALVWYDSAHPDAVFMARNDERPLHYMITDNGKSIVGCSEVGMMEWLATRNKIDKRAGTPSYYISPGVIYKFDLNDIGNFSQVEYPKYDPSTTPVAVLPARVTPVAMYPTKTRSRREWDDHDWGPHYGYHQGNYGSSGYYDDSEEVMDKVKLALRTARYATVPTALDDGDSDGIITQDDLETAVLAAISKSADSVPWKTELDDDALSRGEVFLTSVYGSTVNDEERANAKKLGMYGMVVKFEGTHYDDDMNQCSGTFSLMEAGKEILYDGEMRFIKSNLAHDLYINRDAGDGELCIVVGVHNTVEWLYLEPVTYEQRKFLEEGVLANKSAVMH